MQYTKRENEMRKEKGLYAIWEVGDMKRIKDPYKDFFVKNIFYYTNKKPAEHMFEWKQKRYPDKEYKFYDYTTNNPYADRYKSLEEVAEQLKENVSLETMDDTRYGEYRYHYRVDFDDFTEDFTAYYYGEAPDDSYDWESLDNVEFKFTCKKLLCQANIYIKDKIESEFNLDFEAENNSPTMKM